MLSGKIYMIPCPIVEWNVETIPPATRDIIYETVHFIAERAKTARAFLKAIGHPTPMKDISIIELQKHDQDDQDDQEWLAYLNENLPKYNVGVLSEAGCPGIADPGNRIVDWAHKNQVHVVPLVGPSSILMALMASGLNGQNFTFHGYLPVKKNELVSRLRKLEQVARKHDQTQIFMETPYRNNAMVHSCISTLSDTARLCIAAGIGSKNEDIMTKSISEWRKSSLPDIHNIPAIFLLL